MKNLWTVKYWGCPRWSNCHPALGRPGYGLSKSTSDSQEDFRFWKIRVQSINTLFQLYQLYLVSGELWICSPGGTSNVTVCCPFLSQWANDLEALAKPWPGARICPRLWARFMSTVGFSSSVWPQILSLLVDSSRLTYTMRGLFSF